MVLVRYTTLLYLVYVKPNDYEKQGKKKVQKEA